MLLLSVASYAHGRTISITDMSGRSVSVPFDPDRIVCLGPGSLRLIVYLQAQDKLACIEGMEARNSHGRPYWLAHTALQRLPRCGFGGSAGINKKPDMEAVLDSKAQVIFISYADRELADRMQRILGISVFVLRYGQGEDFDQTFYRSLSLCGKILNRQHRARQMTAYVQSIQKDLARRTAHLSEKNPSVYVGAVSFRGAYGIESTEKQYLPFYWLGVDSVADEIALLGKAKLFVNKERLLEINPTIVFIDGGGLRLVREDYRKRPMYYQEMKAYSDRRVYLLLPFNMYATNVSTALVNAYAVGKIIYPDRFDDIDLEAKADDIYRFMVGRAVYLLMKRDYGQIGQRVLFE